MYRTVGDDRARGRWHLELLCCILEHRCEGRLLRHAKAVRWSCQSRQHALPAARSILPAIPTRLATKDISKPLNITFRRAHRRRAQAASSACQGHARLVSRRLRPSATLVGCAYITRLRQRVCPAVNPARGRAGQLRQRADEQGNSGSARADLARTPAAACRTAPGCWPRACRGHARPVERAECIPRSGATAPDAPPRLCQGAGSTPAQPRDVHLEGQLGVGRERHLECDLGHGARTHTRTQPPPGETDRRGPREQRRTVRAAASQELSSRALIACVFVLRVFLCNSQSAPCCCPRPHALRERAAGWRSSATLRAARARRSPQKVARCARRGGGRTHTARALVRRRPRCFVPGRRRARARGRRRRRGRHDRCPHARCSRREPPACLLRGACGGARAKGAPVADRRWRLFLSLSAALPRRLQRAAAPHAWRGGRQSRAPASECARAPRGARVRGAEGTDGAQVGAAAGGAAAGGAVRR